MTDTTINLTGARGLTVSELLAFHKARFGSSAMEATGGEGGEGGDGAQGGAGTPTPNDAAAQTGKQGSEGESLGSGGVKALQAERDQRKALEKQVADMQSANKAQMEALAKAFGLKTDEVSDTDKLASQLKDLNDKVGSLTKTNTVLRIASEHSLSDKDREIIASLPDETTMQSVAKRLAEAAAPKGKPKADPPSGGDRSSAPVDLPGTARLRAAYAATENTH